MQEKLLCRLEDIQASLNEEISELRDRQARTEENVNRHELQLLSLNRKYTTTFEDVKKIEYEMKKIAASNNEIPYVFHAPKRNPWFGGRSSELEKLGGIFRMDNVSETGKVHVAAVCGLGGVGKTSLATEYAQRKKDCYTGGVYWFSGEDEATFEDSVCDVAARFGTQKNSFGPTFSATLAAISRNKSPWLMVLDNMDQLVLSASITKLISGTWQHCASGHLLITTRRKPSNLANEMRGFDERSCLSLECFNMEKGKIFLFNRTGIRRDDKVDAVAEKLIQQLGGLPLALEQAGAYIKKRHCTLSQYLEEYDLQRLRLLDRQKAAPVSEYDSDQRLAVRTTWHLNFKHIEQTVDGKAAIRFLYASAFLNANEIQKDIINVGKPPVTDEEFGKCVKTTLGCQEILKLLTDFSLFKETRFSNLSVHHLVQEVIQEYLKPEEEIQSIVDAIRMLHHAFRSCSSPDELLSSASGSKERDKRPSMLSSGNLSRFYKWHKLCSHTYELVGHLKRVIKESYVDRETAFQLETARIVYECAIHLSANMKHDEAKEVANFAKELFNMSNQQVPASSVFRHTIPLPELVRRHIQYSCHTPATKKDGECKDDVEMPFDSITSEQLDEMRTKGNDLFRKGAYVDALKIYSDAIDRSKNTDLCDVRLLSNRASVYLNLKRYDEALQDAEEYISKCPKCWKGYARKAIALDQLKDRHGSFIAASLAYYYEKNIFHDFKPFKTTFDSSLVEHLFICGTKSELLEAFRKACTRNVSFDAPEDLPIIILKPGDYRLTLARHLGDFGVLPIENCILIGSEANCSVTFGARYEIRFSKSFIAYNVNFRSHTNVYFQPDSVVKLNQCSFESSNCGYNTTSFYCKGKLKVDSCKFYNCKKGGLLVVGDAEVENSEFCGNEGGGLEVRDGGHLIVRKSKMNANKQGLLIGREVKECVVEGCDIYDNEQGVVVATDCASIAVIRGSYIYDNDDAGVTVKKSNVSLLDNKIQNNTGWGISIENSSQAVVKKNKVYSNQCGGVCVGADIAETGRPVIEYNDIANNLGPGLCDKRQLSKCTGNTFQNNRDVRNQSTAESAVKICYSCKKAEKNLKRCTKCYTAVYCGNECQKKDWKDHKMKCKRLLSDASIVLNYVRRPVVTPYSQRGPGLLPVGPDHSQPPSTTARFIVKMSAGVATEDGSSVVKLYDRSLTIDGMLTEADQIYNLVCQHGTRGQLNDYWKKLFMWVQGPNDGKLRVFTNEFPSYQKW